MGSESGDGCGSGGNGERSFLGSHPFAFPQGGFWATEESKDGALGKIKIKGKSKIKIKGKIKGCGRGRPLYMYGLLGEGTALGFFSQGG